MFRCSGALIFWCLDVQRLRCWEYDHVVQCSNVHKFIWSEVECSSVQMFRGSDVQKPTESAANISCHCKCQAFENFIWWRKMPAGTSCRYFKQGSDSSHVQGSLWLMQTWWNLPFGSFMQTWLNSQIWLTTFSRLDVTSGDLGYLISRQWGGGGGLLSVALRAPCFDFDAQT